MEDRVEEAILVMVAKTRFNNGFCYFAENPTLGIVRPIKSYNSKKHSDNCCWEAHLHNYNINDIIKVSIIKCLFGKRVTEFPHGHNDLFVMDKVEKIGSFGKNLNLAKRLTPYLNGRTIENLFSPFGYYQRVRGHFFMKEGAPCSSVAL